MKWIPDNVDSYDDPSMHGGWDKMADMQRQHFQMHFLERKFLYFNWNFTEIVKAWEDPIDKKSLLFNLLWSSDAIWQHKSRSELNYCHICHGPMVKIMTYCVLTHWGRYKMTVNFLTTFSNAFSWMKVYKFRLRFHLSFFLGDQLTIFQHWFR